MRSTKGGQWLQQAILEPLVIPLAVRQAVGADFFALRC
jgi:hypothetical protein